MNTCDVGCHPTWCRNVTLLPPSCPDTGGVANYTDCVDLTEPWPYTCGYCPGTEPIPSGTPLPTPIGSTPTPFPTSIPTPGTIRARAMVVANSLASCTDVRNSTTGITDTAHRFTPSSASQPAPQIQSGTTYVVFNNLVPGSYTIDPIVPDDGYVPVRACWDDSVSATSGEGYSQTLTSSSTLTWNLGYTLGTSWSQASGGDVYAAGTLKSFIPPGTFPEEFILDGAGGYPGVATYGSAYDFDSSSADGGETQVSSTDWLANDMASTADFYEILFKYAGSPAPTVSGDTTLDSQLVGSTTYYYDGNLTVNAPAWTIPNGDKVMVFVRGNLLINTPIAINPEGFLAFIVKGNITIDPSVGAVAGIYVTSPAGTFSTGAGSARFIGRGMFVAGSFLLQRDLGTASNTTTPSELFMYNPQLLLTMPEKMKQLSVSWQEVAP